MPWYGDNRRAYFRVMLGQLPADLQIITIGDRPITTHVRSVQIINASGGGVCFRCDEDLPIRRGVVVHLRFAAGGADFSFRGVLTRKLDDMSHFEYGTKFIDIDEYQQGQLVSILGRIQVETSRSKTGT